jgi:hypothetical protein
VPSPSSLQVTLRFRCGPHEEFCNKPVVGQFARARVAGNPAGRLERRLRPPRPVNSQRKRSRQLTSQFFASPSPSFFHHASMAGWFVPAMA